MTETDSGIRDKWAVLNEKDKGRRVVAACIVLSVVIAVTILFKLTW